MTITFRSSVIFVRDIAASGRFYEELLGQEVEAIEGPSMTFKGGLALWQVDHAFQVVYGRSLDNAGQLGGQNCELHFETADAKGVSARLSEAGVPFVHALREMPWGKRILRVRDPDGHIFAVGEPMGAVIARLLDQGMSAEAVAKRTGMSIEVVEQTAKGDV